MKGFYDENVYSDGKLYNFFEEKKEKGEALKDYNLGQTIEVKLVPIYEIFFKIDTGFGVYDCDLVIDGDNSDEPDTFIITGQFLSSLDIGQTYLAKGVVVEKDGKNQLSIEYIMKTQPTNKKAIMSFIESLEGAKTFAEIIYEDFGENTIDVIKNNPYKLLDTSPAIYEDLVLSWQKQALNTKDDEEYIMMLESYGLSLSDARLLFSKYKEHSLTLIQDNPYFLSKELRGYGFLKSDKIARAIGISPKSPDRIQVGIIQVLRDIQQEGHIYLPKDELYKRAIDLLSVKLTYNEMNELIQKNKGKKIINYKYGNLSYEVEYDRLLDAYIGYNEAYSRTEQQKNRLIVVEITKKDIDEQIPVLIAEKRILNINNNYYIYEYYMAEQNIASSIFNIVNNQRDFPYNVTQDLNQYLNKNNITLEEKQYQAALATTKTKGGFYIINGSAGCGKTFTLKIILDVLKKQHIKDSNYFDVMLLAPTGKAAKVAEEATGVEAKTIHRALGYNPNNGFTFNSRNPMIADCIVIDESSMIDLYMAEALLTAITPSTKVIMLGDVQQLASIGAGNVFKDIIESKKVNVLTLDVVKRQDGESGIIENANRIIKKEIISTNKKTKDTIVQKANNEFDGLKKILHLYNILLNKYGIDETQVLSPMKGGILGINYLNHLLQHISNPNAPDKLLHKKFNIQINKKVRSIKTYFREGDKVMNVDYNIYDMPIYELKDDAFVLNRTKKGVINGDMGRIFKITKLPNEDGKLEDVIIVDFGDGFAFYRDDFKSLELSYAMTIHKSQGSEWDGVIIPIFLSHYNMLDNNLFYTGYTRAKDFSAVVCDVKALQYATNSIKSADRYTSLDSQIKHVFNN